MDASYKYVLKIRTFCINLHFFKAVAVQVGQDFTCVKTKKDYIF